MSAHYLQLVLPEGSHSIKREYLELTHEDETIEQATERWVELKLGNRQRSRAKVGAQLLNSIISRRICHPSSWHRSKAESAGQSWPVAPRGRRRR